MTRYQLDQAVLCTQRGQLRVDGVDVPLGSRACALLEVLVTHEGRLVSKAELMAMVWPRLVVEENNLHVQVAALRKALGARAIVNVPGRGYRYVGSIQRLADDASPAPAARPSATPPAPPAGEPAEADRTLIGRSAELDDLCAQVRQQALVTVVGAGGMGKTRLALAAAAQLGSQFADGARVVDLAAVASPAEVPAQVGRAFGIQLGASDGALAALVERLGRSSALLVLDNCEHVVGVVAELVSALLAAAPGLHVLATSQEPLHLKDERQCRLAPLAVPAEGEPGDPALHPALALLAQRVRAQQGRFDLDASTLGDATDIVRRLDGVPLAIELAAARVPLLGLAGVRRHLDERLHLLASATRDLPARQRTLRAMLDWSHALLGPAEQRVFRRLAVCTGSFGLELAQAVATEADQPAWEVLDLLGTLVDKSLLVVLPEALPRYRLLESARAYGLEQLERSGEAAAVRRAHAEAVRQVLGAGLRTALQGRISMDQWCVSALPELDNLRAAVTWAGGPQGDLTLAITLVNLATGLMYQTGRYLECCHWMCALEPRLPGDLPERVRATFLHGLALSGIHTLPAARRAALVEQACDIFRRNGPPDALANSLCVAAWVHAVSGQPEQGLQRLTEVDALLGPGARVEMRTMWLFNRGVALRLADRLEEAAADYLACLPMARQSGQVRWVLNTLTNLGLTARERGLLNEAMAWYDELLRVLASLPYVDPERWAFALMGSMRCLSERGDLAAAGQRLQQALPHARRSLSLRYFGDLMADLAVRQGRWRAAVMLIGANGAMREASGEVREPTCVREVNAMLAQVRQAGHGADIEHWLATGRHLDEDGAQALALGE